jgi:hypothetical protein
MTARHEPYIAQLMRVLLPEHRIDVMIQVGIHPHDPAGYQRVFRCLSVEYDLRPTNGRYFWIQRADEPATKTSDDHLVRGTE